MDNGYFILLCLLPMDLQALVPFLDPNARILESETTKVLQEILEGPLKNREVTMLVEGEVQERIDVNRIMSSFSVPASLLFLTEDMYEEDIDEQIIPAVATVIVGVVSSGSSWLFSSPPDWWLPEAILLIAVGESCKAQTLLQTPLLETTTSVAVLCPFLSSGDPQFRVVTWLPYAVHENLLKLGDWDPKAFSTWDQLFYDRFKDFGGKAIHLASDYDDMPLIFETDDGLDGTNIRMIDALAASFNFTYTSTFQAPDAEWGERDENGTWSGMLGEIHREEKDMAINYFTVTVERAEDFDYSVPYYNEGFGLVLKVPPPLPRWRNLVYPFTGAVWASVGGTFVFTVFIFHLLAKTKSKTPFVYNFTTLYQGITTQSIAKIPSSWLVRGFLSVWWFMCWILDISYTCNLIAVLTVPVYPTRIETVDDLAFSDLRLCMLDYGEFVPGALATSSDPAFAALGAKTDLVPIDDDLDYYGEEGCVELVLAGTHAHTETYSYAKLIYSDLGHGSTVYAMKPQLYEGNLAFFFRKRTPWRKKFNAGITRLVESGLVQKWYHEIMSAGESRQVESTELQSLSIAHLQGPFMALALGLLLGLIVFIAELTSFALSVREFRDSASS